MQKPKTNRAKLPAISVIANELSATPGANPKAGRMRVAAYLRYSTDGQKATSTVDQLRSCNETVARLGLEVSPDLIFSDDAITGAAKGTHMRESYHAMRAAVCAGQIDVIVCDQQCRLARSAKESISLFEELQAFNVRLLTADGFDSEAPTSQLVYGIKSVFSEFFLYETRHRVKRGMVGEFERGAMVTAIPFGYQVDAILSHERKHCVWAVNHDQAAIVIEIYECRMKGMSFNQIAAVLNVKGVPTSRGEAEGGKTYWRASSVWRVLQNPIYKGVYVVNFRRPKGEQGGPAMRFMPDLMLVSSEVWQACQTKGKRSESGKAAEISSAPRKGTYGGGRHALAGVLSCGTCGVALSCHHAKNDAGSLHCVQCEHATASGIAGRQPLYVSVKGVNVMLKWLLGKVISSEAIDLYREDLKSRLLGGRDAELAELQERLRRAKGAHTRLARMLREIGEDDRELEAQFLQAREDVFALEHQIAEIEHHRGQVNHETLKKQINVDISCVLDSFLSDNVEPGRTRALLKGIFPRIVLLGKHDRYTAIFEVHVRTGAIFAAASETDTQEGGETIFYLQLNTSSSKYPVWTVEEIQRP